jgi:hypothetical protein
MDSWWVEGEFSVFLLSQGGVLITPTPFSLILGFLVGNFFELPLLTHLGAVSVFYSRIPLAISFNHNIWC